MKVQMRLLLVITALTLAALACQLTGNSEAGDGGSESIPAQIPPTAAVTTPKLPPAATPKGAGMACVGLRAGGISCLSENGWQTFTEENSDLPSNYVDAGALCPDGRIAISHYEGVSLFDGSLWENINSAGNYSSTYGLACEPGGGIWVAHFEGVSHYTNGNWTVYPASDLSSGEFANDLVYGVAVAPDGTVWVATSRSVAQFDGGAWTVFQQGSGFDAPVFFNAIVVDSLNRPWVGASDGMYVYENGAWSKIDKNDYATPQSMSIDARGQVWVGTLSNGAATYNGNAWNNYNTASNSLLSDQVNGIASDSLGRVWVGTTYGLAVYDGAAWQNFRMDNADLGDNYIEFVVVANDGSDLPSETEKPASGLTGSLNTADNQPLAGMRVEICVEPLSSTFSGDTPCSDQPFFRFTETDQDGVFTFSDVPAGYYVIVAETGDGWAQLTDEFGIGSERTLLPSGEVYDIGVLTLEE